jgi:hypothetical protein
MYSLLSTAFLLSGATTPPRGGKWDIGRHAETFLWVLAFVKRSCRFLIDSARNIGEAGRWKLAINARFYSITAYAKNIPEVVKRNKKNV